MSDAQRELFTTQKVNSDTAWTILVFSKRMALFALRENDPQLFKLAMVAFGMVDDRNDPRDIMKVSSELIYLGLRLGLKPERFVEQGWIHSPWMQKWFDNVAQRPREDGWEKRDWHIREVQTELGLGLIRCDGNYHPQTDLIKLAMRICRIIESDLTYLSTTIVLDNRQPKPKPHSELIANPNSIITPCTGCVWISGYPNPDFRPEMKNQSLHVRLYELGNDEQVRKLTEEHKFPSNLAGLMIADGRLILTLTAKSWVLGRRQCGNQ